MPITGTIPPIVRQMSANLALCFLYDRRREMDIPEGIADRRKRFLKLLGDIRDEKAAIPELSKNSPGVFTVSRVSTDQIFSDDLLSQM